MVSVIIPVYNERDTIAGVLSGIRSVPLAKEIIVVDDGSSDGTADILIREKQADSALIVITHNRNRGKGAAVRSAISVVSGDIVIIQDGDAEYDPADYPRLLGPILAGRADVVYGSRFAGGEEHRVLYFWHYVGNKVLTLLSNMFTNLNLTDMETGFKVFKAQVIKAMRLEQNRFGFEPEITARIAAMQYRIYEVGISYRGRTYAEGKKIKWTDGAAAVWFIIKYGLSCKKG